MRAGGMYEVKRPFTIIRLWPQHHKDERLLSELIAAFKRYPGCCDEVWFSTEFGFPKMSVHKESARLLKRAAQTMRDAGILPGLQIANILGHADLSSFASDGINWRGIVGPDGTVARMCNCPRDPALHNYVREMMTLYAASRPSSVWIDDDTPRMHHHTPVEFGCFCDVCVADFSRRMKRPFTRESLVAALHDPKDGALRLAWTRFNQESIALVGKTVAQAVHAVAPRCRMAAQHCGHEWGMYTGPDYKPFFETMAKITGMPVCSRPGGGFYTDHAPRGMIHKGLELSRQVARLPKCVDTVCPEVENFTHISMGKTPHGTVVESSLDLALGCNCLSYAILCSGHESLDWYGLLLDRIARWRPFWQRYLNANEGTVPGGLNVALSCNHVARPLLPDERPFAWARIDLSRPYKLAAIGLPLCTSPKAACATLLTRDTVPGMTDAELKEALSGGVIMDGVALACLQERVPPKWLGVAAGRPDRLDSHEVFTDDPLNGDFKGAYWKLIFFGDPKNHGVFVLKPLSKKTHILGRYVNKDGRVTGIATTAVENALGGRVAVLGYDGFDPVVSTARRAQMLAASDWVSRGRLPVIIDTPAQVMAVPRLNARRRLRSVFLLNASIDATPALRLRARGTTGGKCTWFTPETPPVELPCVSIGPEKRLVTPPLGPWQVACCAFIG